MVEGDRGTISATFGTSAGPPSPHARSPEVTPRRNSTVVDSTAGAAAALATTGATAVATRTGMRLPRRRPDRRHAGCSRFRPWSAGSRGRCRAHDPTGHRCRCRQGRSPPHPRRDGSSALRGVPPPSTRSAGSRRQRRPHRSPLCPAHPSYVPSAVRPRRPGCRCLHHGAQPRLTHRHCGAQTLAGRRARGDRASAGAFPPVPTPPTRHARSSVRERRKWHRTVQTGADGYGAGSSYAW